MRAWHMRLKIMSLVVGSGLAASLLGPSRAAAQTVGTAASFAIVGGSAVSANGTGSIVNGDVGVSPGTSITGFPANATITPPFATHADPDGLAISAQTSVTALYVALGHRTLHTPGDATGHGIGRPRRLLLHVNG